MRRAFSLVEVLVVISILIILTAIMLSVVSSAKKSGNTISCTEHLHQLSLAASLYEQDNDGKLPYILFADVGPLERYVKSKELFFCTQDPFPNGANAQASRRLGSKVSYFSVITISKPFMEALAQLDQNPGVFTCLVHGERIAQGAVPASAYYGYSGPVLTSRKDGSVVRLHPPERCYSDQSRGRLWWDFFSEEPPPSIVVADLTAGATIVPCK